MDSFKQFVSNRRAASRRSTASLGAACASAALAASVLLGSPAAQAAGPAAAAFGGDPPSVAVRYGDLNLASEHGARILLERLQHAATTVCPYADERGVDRRAIRNRCVREAVARAVRQVGSPILAALYTVRAEHG
jgi:UrcA family protein